MSVLTKKNSAIILAITISGLQGSPALYAATCPCWGGTTKIEKPHRTAPATPFKVEWRVGGKTKTVYYRFGEPRSGTSDGTPKGFSPEQAGNGFTQECYGDGSPGNGIYVSAKAWGLTPAYTNSSGSTILKSGGVPVTTTKYQWWTVATNDSTWGPYCEGFIRELDNTFLPEIYRGFPVEAVGSPYVASTSNLAAPAAPPSSTFYSQLTKEQLQACLNDLVAATPAVVRPDPNAADDAKKCNQTWGNASWNWGS